MSKAYRGPGVEVIREQFAFERRKKVVVTTCPACGFAEREAVAEKERYGFPITSYVCLQCGMMYLSPRLSPREYAVLYGGLAPAQDWQAEGVRQTWYHALVAAFWHQGFGPRRYRNEQLKYREPLVRFLTPFLQIKDCRILDIGGSIGMVSEAVAEACPGRTEVTVLDPSKAELKEARKLGHKTICTTFEKWAPGDETWDIILLCRTIDHVWDPVGVLSRIHTAMTATSQLYVDYVDYQNIVRRRGSARAAQIDHPSNFAPFAFNQLMHNTGFEKVSEMFRFTVERGFVFKTTKRPDPVYDPQKARELVKYARMIDSRRKDKRRVQGQLQQDAESVR